MGISSREIVETRQEPATLADRLAAARRNRFVGRESELELFRKGLDGEFAVLQLFGPGGVGKTTLLNRFAALAQEQGIPAVLLDGRNLDPTPVGFELGLQLALGPEANPQELMARHQRFVLLLDTYETLSPLDGWLRDRFLPKLPAGVLVILAGRNPPTDGWKSDPGWGALFRSLALRNLRPEESKAYLEKRGVPEEAHQEVLAFTHGHPLALSMLADVVGQSGKGINLQQTPDLVSALLKRFIQEVPSPLHRLALETCAQARVTTEALLRWVLRQEDVHPFFEWLRGLSFIEQGPLGLFPHDLAREVIEADQRWRDPQAYAELHRQIRREAAERVHRPEKSQQMRAVADNIYLHRNNPIMKAYFEFKTVGGVYTETARPDDYAALRLMTERHEGSAAVEQLNRWLNRQPEAFTVVRSQEAEVLGFIAHLDLSKAAAEDLEADPIVKPIWAHIQRNVPLRPSEVVLLSRFMMDGEQYQQVSAVFNALQIAQTRDWLTTPNLAYSLQIISSAERWSNLLNYVDFQRIPELDAEVGGMQMATFAHDWRQRPVVDWLKLMGSRGTNTDMKPQDLQSKTEVLVLSQPDFAEAIKQALRDYHQPNLLQGNPLMRSRLVRKNAKEPSPQTLRAVLWQAAEQLKLKPKDQKFYRAIEATYLEPASTQELAAERLGLPFGTYRYQLATGLERITEWLWRQEVYGEK